MGGSATHGEISECIAESVVPEKKKVSK